MPIVQPGAKVLVSGANGFLAIWVVRTLLEKGYAVRGTIRSADKAIHLNKIFAEYGDKHEVVVVKDITRPGAFDDAVKGVDAIQHISSPAHFESGSPGEMIVPAVNGTVGILQSALTNGSSVKRIVITSSASAIRSALETKPRVFSEKDWNEEAHEVVKQKGKDAGPVLAYQASKTLAEKAAWEFVAKNKDEIHWDLVVLNSPWVYGPVIREVNGPQSLNMSIKLWYNTVLSPKAGGLSPMELSKIGTTWVDVRDISEAHVLAIETAEAGGERIIISTEPYAWQDWLDAANALPPSLLSTLANPNLYKGNPGTGYANPENPILCDFDTSKADRLFRLKYRSIEDCTRDMVADFARRGW